MSVNILYDKSFLDIEDKNLLRRTNKWDAWMAL